MDDIGGRQRTAQQQRQCHAHYIILRIPRDTVSESPPRVIFDMDRIIYIRVSGPMRLGLFYSRRAFYTAFTPQRVEGPKEKGVSPLPPTNRGGGSSLRLWETNLEPDKGD